MKNFISEYLSDDSLETITGEIAKIENGTSGELRLCIKKRRGFLERKKTPREIALKQFVKLNMHKTKDKTGVLMLLLLDDHRFEIIADEGINSKISDQQWEEIASRLTGHFREGKYLDGILFGIRQIGEVLNKEFPVKPDDKDELSNDVVIG